MQSGTQSPHSSLLQWHVLNLLAKITGGSQKILQSLSKSITNQSITRIGVYGVDEQNRCHVSLQLRINWAAGVSQVLALGDWGAIAESVTTENGLSPEVLETIAVFNQEMAAGNLRTKWYYPEEQALDPAVIDQEAELPELQGLFQGFLPADVSSSTDSWNAFLQRLYAVDILTKSSQRSVNIVRKSPMKEGEVAEHVERLRHEGQWGEGKSITPPTVRQHVEQLREEAKIPQGIIYQPGNLPEKYENYAKEFVEALGNEQHSLRQPVERLLRKFAAARVKEKPQATSLSQAARDYGIPLKNLSEWVAAGLIPVQNRDKNTIYLARDTLEKVAPIYHEARARRKLAAPLLRKMHDDLFAASSTSPQD